MKKSLLLLSGVLLLAALSPCITIADASKSSVKSFSEMLKIAQQTDSPASTLVVMDNDDTLTTMSCPQRDNSATCQYLGGAAWFDWQESQLEAMSQPRIANTFPELLSASALLFSTNYMPYSAPDVAGVLNALTASGVRLMVETARGNENISATESQFQILATGNKQYGNLLSLISNHSLKFGAQGLPSRASPYPPCGDSAMRPITYRQGTMYLAGQDKGKILKCMLDEYNAQPGAKTITHVIFIDDTKKNVINVRDAFEKSTKYKVHALHYTALEKHKKAFSEGKMAHSYQQTAMRRWGEISKVLQQNLQNPMLP